MVDEKGRKKTGGLLTISLKQRQPLVGKDISVRKENWIFLEETLQNAPRIQNEARVATSTANSTSTAAVSKPAASSSSRRESLNSSRRESLKDPAAELYDFESDQQFHK